MSPAAHRRACCVVDLGFGDCGKGLVTDYLVRSTGAGLVVRFNGGAQAGHNVVAPDGRHHTFAQFGAGTLAGARTFLSRHVVVHPTALLLEAQALERTGVSDPLSRIRVSEGARIVTPFHQAANRLRELARGDARHGSCGVGIGETVEHALDHPDEAVTARDLRDVRLLRRKLERIRERKRNEVAALVESQPALEASSERACFERDDVADAWIEQARGLAASGAIAADSLPEGWLAGARSVVFEGAQGVLLDEERGFHPHTTWSRCTPANARELLAEWAPGLRLETVGVLRSHAVRHGPGPLPSECEEVRPAVQEHNEANPWQGGVRYGWFDGVLARYALEVAGEVDRVALTHLDLVPRLARILTCAAYRLPAGEGGAAAAESVSRLVPAEPASLEGQARLGRLLASAEPVLAPASPAEPRFLATIESLLGRAVDFVARGPRAPDVEERTPARRHASREGREDLDFPLWRPRPPRR